MKGSFPLVHLYNLENFLFNCHNSQLLAKSRIANIFNSPSLHPLLPVSQTAAEWHEDWSIWTIIGIWMPVPGLSNVFCFQRMCKRGQVEVDEIEFNASVLDEVDPNWLVFWINKNWNCYLLWNVIILYL